MHAFFKVAFGSNHKEIGELAKEEKDHESKIASLEKNHKDHESKIASLVKQLQLLQAGMLTVITAFWQGDEIQLCLLDSRL